MRLFEEPEELHRIAVFGDYEFPVARDQQVYERLDQLSEQLGAMHRQVHCVVGDPTGQPSEVRHRYGSGLLVLTDPQMQCNDVEHLRATLSERFDAFIRALAVPMSQSVPALIATPDVQAASSATRWLRAWRPDLIVSVGLSQYSLQAMLPSYVLQIPRLVILDEAIPESPLLAALPHFTQEATWILVGDENVRAQLEPWLGSEMAAQLHVRERDHRLPKELEAQIRNRFATVRATDAVALGVRAAFRTNDVTPTDVVRAEAQPLLIVGAERSGTNWFVNTLDRHAKLRLANELFNPRTIEAGELEWNGDVPIDEERLRRLRRARPDALLSELLREGHQQSATYAGFKLLYYHGLSDDRVTDMLLSRENLRAVHLTRKQLIERFVSLVRARTSDEWFHQPTADRAPEPLRLDLRAMVTEFVQTAQFEARYRAMLQGHDVLEISYEELAADTKAALHRLGEWLGVDLSQLTPNPRTPVSRQIHQSIANWQQVREALVGTCWHNLCEADV